MNNSITQKRPPGADAPSSSLNSGIQLYAFAFGVLVRAFTLSIGLSAWTPVLSAAGRPMSYVFCLGFHQNAKSTVNFMILAAG